MAQVEPQGPDLSDAVAETELDSLVTVSGTTPPPTYPFGTTRLPHLMINASFHDVHIHLTISSLPRTTRLPAPYSRSTMLQCIIPLTTQPHDVVFLTRTPLTTASREIKSSSQQLHENNRVLVRPLGKACKVMMIVLHDQV